MKSGKWIVEYSRYMKKKIATRDTKEEAIGFAVYCHDDCQGYVTAIINPDGKTVMDHDGLMDHIEKLDEMEEMKDEND